MKDREIKLMEAIYVIVGLDLHRKVTIGELARWTKIPKTSTRRILEKLCEQRLVSTMTFSRAGNICWDFYLTTKGLTVVQEIRRLQKEAKRPKNPARSDGLTI